MKILDLFCGLGGWSIPFAELGCECTGVDTRKLGYPYRFIQCDILDWEPDQEYDVVLMSPPCSEFSTAKYFAHGTQKEHEGLDLVQRSLYLINVIKPKFWIMENVKHLSDFIGPPNDIVKYGKRWNRKKAYLWGNFPKINLLESVISYRTHDFTKSSDPQRAMIPKPLAQTIAKAIFNQFS